MNAPAIEAERASAGAERDEAVVGRERAPRAGRPGRRKYSALVFALVFTTYLLTALAGLRWALIQGAGSPVWPAAGVAFAAMVLAGLRYWPALVLARFAAAVIVESAPPLWADLVIALGAAIGAAVPVWLIRRAWRFSARLDGLPDMLSLIFGGAGLGATLSAGIGGLSLWLAGVSGEMLIATTFNWWFGYAVGALVAAPLILSWSRLQRWPAVRILHFATCMLTGAALAALIFLQPRDAGLWPFHVFPIFVWAAIAFRIRGVAGLLLITSAFALIGAAEGLGPLNRIDMVPAERVFLTQQFIGMVALTMLLLAAAMEQRRGIEAQARLAAIVASSADAMISFSNDGAVRSWNAGAEALFGYREDEVIGRSGQFLLPPEEIATGGAFRMAMQQGVVRLDTVRLDRDGERVDVSISANRMTAPDGAVIGVSAVMRDIRARKRAERHQQLLIHELNHRVKNTLAIVQGLAQQSFKRVANEDAQRAFDGRLMALASAHNLLTDQRWERAPLAALVAEVLAPYRGETAERVTLAGPAVDLDPQTAVAIAMALHELATNAAKYGALSVPGGHVAIAWSCLDDGGPRVALDWVERGGPPVEPPSRRGFGTRLIERGLSADLKGRTQIDFHPHGVVARLEAPRLPDVAAMERKEP